MGQLFVFDHTYNGIKRNKHITYSTKMTIFSVLFIFELFESFELKMVFKVISTHFRLFNDFSSFIGGGKPQNNPD